MSDLLTQRDALFSDCRTWRYRLSLTWDPSRWPMFVLMLNPSTADEVANDPTVERCERRARRLDYGGLVVLNLFAYRATDPDDMKRAPDPVGPENDRIIRETLKPFPDLPGREVLAGWGAHGGHLGRDRAVAALLAELGSRVMCLGTTAAGQPRHPLYLKNDAELRPWSPPS